MKKSILELRPAGYTYILKNLGLTALTNWHTSFVSLSGTQKSKVQGETIKEIYPKRYWPGDNMVSHIEFALKYDGVNLGVLALIFEHIPQAMLTEYIQSKPTGKYARRIWFFYEFLTNKKLALDDIMSGN